MLSKLSTVGGGRYRLLFSFWREGRYACPLFPLAGDQEGKIKPSINSWEMECLERAQFHLPAGERLGEGQGAALGVQLCSLVVGGIGEHKPGTQLAQA